MGLENWFRNSGRETRGSRKLALENEKNAMVGAAAFAAVGAAVMSQSGLDEKAPQVPDPKHTEQHQHVDAKDMAVMQQHADGTKVNIDLHHNIATVKLPAEKVTEVNLSHEKTEVDLSHPKTEIDLSHAKTEMKAPE